jgi:hypothetical protein
MSQPNTVTKGGYSGPLEALRTNKAALVEVLERYGLINPRLFGSLARGEARPTSDIDILVSKTVPMSYSTIAKLRREVTEALGWRVDLVFDTALKPEMEDEILHDARPMP